MGLLGALLRGSQSHRNYGRRSYGYGRRAAAPGFFGSPLGRLALGGLAAYGARRWYGRGRTGVPSGGMPSGFPNQSSGF